MKMVVKPTCRRLQPERETRWLVIGGKIDHTAIVFRRNPDRRSACAWSGNGFFAHPPGHQMQASLNHA